jgi:hypothetical protein
VEYLGKDNSNLFQGLKIMEAGEKYLSHLGKYPIISLSLKSAKQPIYELAYEELKKRIGEEYKRHEGYILQSSSLTSTDKKRYSAILDFSASDSAYLDSLQFLSACLYQYYKQKTIILIDEYDVPLNNAYLEDKGENLGFYKEMTSFIRSLFESALKTNEALEFAVITGCLRITKESIFTGLNNLEVISILNKGYGENFGFTQQEVSKMLDYYELKSKENLIKDWYNGYMFGDSEVYNPWSVLNFVKELRVGETAIPKPYWANTSSNSIVKELVERADNVVKGEIEELIAGKSIEKPVREEITYADVYQSSDNLWNFLFFTGYLKKVNERLASDNNRMVTLAIPNIEVGQIYKNTILQWFKDRVAQRDYGKFHEAFLAGDTENLTLMINQELLKTISYSQNKEEVYHVFLATLIGTMENVLVSSNRESGHGRYDIVVKIPSASEYRAIILELKVVKKFRELEAACDKALAQIENKKYAEELMEEGYTGIIKYGIAFYGKRCLVKIAY